jgi:hypothetical protein
MKNLALKPTHRKQLIEIHLTHKLPRRLHPAGQGMIGNDHT